MSGEFPRGFDLTSRVKLRVTGADCLRFLNGQVTNDVRKVTDGDARMAAVLTAKGRMNAAVFITKSDDAYWLDAEAELREQLVARLERYIIADDVQLTDVTDKWTLLHLLGSEGPKISGIERSITSDRFGEPGVDLWVPQAEGERVVQEIGTTFSMQSAEAMETLRIERGMPRWGRELTEEIIPIEANLETAAVDYAKGCYIGQEVISRMKMSGQTNKRLVGFVSVNSEPLEAGMRLVGSATEAREAGWITSAVRSERLGREIALGYLKRSFGGEGDHLRARRPNDVSGDLVAVEIVALPFV